MPRIGNLCNFRRRVLPTRDILAPAGVVLGSGTLLATIIFCGNWEVVGDGDGNGRDSQTHIASLDPTNRFQHDYAGWDESGDDCLERTGYDLFDAGHNQLRKVGKLSIRGSIITVTPGEPNQHAEPIELRFDAGSQKGELPLQPANAESAEILTIHGCNVTSY